MSDDPNRFRISEKLVAQRYGVHPRTLKRRSQSELQFPKAHKVGGKRFNWFDELLAWERINPEYAPAVSK